MLKKNKSINLESAYPYILIIMGIVGVLSSVILTVDKMNLLANPSYSPSCDLNPVVSCGSVMHTWQSEALGVDNSIFGIIAFSMLTAAGGLLLAGAKLKKWFWQVLQAGVTLGVIVVLLFITTSLFVIHSLCPYCMIVWCTTIVVFLYTTLYNIENKILRPNGNLLTIANFVRRHHIDTLLAIAVTIIILILKQFWYYYGPILGF